MDNLEMVMEKSWKNIVSSVWEPCRLIKCTAYVHVTVSGRGWSYGTLKQNQNQQNGSMGQNCQNSNNERNKIRRANY